MSIHDEEQEALARLRETYPDASKEEVKGAHRRLAAYLALVIRMQERLERERRLDGK